MTLTLSDGPLAAHGPEAVNYEIDGPKHRLLFSVFPRRVRALLGGETVLDTTAGMLLHESQILPRLYFPLSDLRSDLLEPSDHSTHCPFKGDASYRSIRVGDQFAENALWLYEQPIDEASWLDGYGSLYWEKMDSWFDEDEEVFVHVRDPYHRVDVRESSRHVRVLAGDEVVAETSRPKLLSETGVPNRWYIPREDVRTEILTSSETTTHCPYKGQASYYSLSAGRTEVEDAAWYYPEPLENALKARDHLCFMGDAITTEVDGSRL